MLRRSLFIITLAVLIASGVAQGYRTDRWGYSADSVAAVEKLKNLPSTIGNWYSSEVPLEDRELTASGALGYISRKYVSRDDGSSVNVMILCGRHGPISIHPPTICFVGAGWGLVSEPRKYAMQLEGRGQEHNFWLADFTRRMSGVPYTMRTLWGWSDGGEWQAADYPRIQYAASPYLYKIYVTFLVPDKQEPVDGSTSVEFMNLLLAELDKNVISQKSN